MRRSHSVREHPLRPSAVHASPTIVRVSYLIQMNSLSPSATFDETGNSKARSSSGPTGPQRVGSVRSASASCSASFLSSSF